MQLELKIMLFKHKITVKVDMADLEDEKTNLADFLQSQYKLNSTITPKGLELNTEDTQTSSVLIMVKKFIHNKNLSSTHGVNAENNVVKIYKFKGNTKKKEKHDKTAHQNITQSWGL
jgi:translation initiation factor IF-3